MKEQEEAERRTTITKLTKLLIDGETLVERMKNALRVLRKDKGDNRRTVQVYKIHEDIILPRYMTSGAAAMDLYAEITEPVDLIPNNVYFINTGIKVAIPEGYQISIRPRSGMGKKGIIIPNSPGTIDSDYRGEIMVMLTNVGKVNYTINPGDRIAQALLEKVYKIDWLVTNELSETERGAGGFGSTGG